MLPRPEILSSEILALEIAADPWGVPQEVSFLGAGAATVVPDLATVASTSADAQGATTTAFNIQGVSPADTHIGGVAAGTWHAESIEHLTFSGAGQATVEAHPGYIRTGAFFADGTSVAEFEVLTEPGFDISGLTTVAFYTAAMAGAEAEIAGSSDVLFESQSVARASTDIAGVGVVEPHAQGITGTQWAAPNAASVDFHGGAKANAVAESGGVGTFTPRVHQVHSTDLDATGGAQANFDVAPLVRASTVATAASFSQVAFYGTPMVRVPTEFGARGEAEGVMQLQTLTWIRGDARGGAEVLFRRGREVQTHLVQSLDAVERPEEVRAVERPEEDRAVEWS